MKIDSLKNENVKMSAKRQDKSVLSEKTKTLLMRYYDGEASWIGSLFAKNILNKSLLAQNFVADLRQVKEQVNEKDRNDSRVSKQVDLWDRISMRIEQEEQAALYLGQRKFEEPSKPSIWNNLKEGWLVGVPAGAVVAVMAMLMIGENSNITSQKIESASNVDANQQVVVPETNFIVPSTQAVSAKSVRSNQRNYVDNMQLAELDSNKLEVDWLRSDGRVQMIHRSEKNAPIIWINRSEVLRRLSQRGLVAENNPNGIKILENRAPASIAVTNDFNNR